MFRMWLGTWVCLFCTWRRLICRKWTVTYQSQYFTINSSISEYDHKCGTQYAEPEIGTDGSSQTRLNQLVDGYWSGFGKPRVRGSGCWTDLEPNRLVFVVQTWTAGWLPRPVSNTMPDVNVLGWCMLCQCEVGAWTSGVQLIPVVVVVWGRNRQTQCWVSGCCPRVWLLPEALVWGWCLSSGERLAWLNWWVFPY